MRDLPAHRAAGARAVRRGGRGQASTAFLIKRGKIAYWIRVPEDVDEAPAPDASGTGST